MQYPKFSCSLILIGLLGTACQKEAMVSPVQSNLVASVSSGRGQAGNPNQQKRPPFERQNAIRESSPPPKRTKQPVTYKHRPNSNVSSSKRDPNYNPFAESFRKAIKGMEAGATTTQKPN